MLAANIKDHFAALVSNEFEGASKKLMDADLKASGLEASDLYAFPLKHLPPMRKQEWIHGAYQIPYLTPEGAVHPHMYRVKLFWKPHVTTAMLKEEGLNKYTQPSAEKLAAVGVHGNYPYLLKGEKNAARVLLICEGEKKSAVALNRLKCSVVGVGGANAWRSERGSGAVHPEILRVCSAKWERILIVPDPDFLTNTNVSAGWTGLYNRLETAFPDTEISVVVLEDKLDDFLLNNQEFSLKDLLKREPVGNESLRLSVRDLVQTYGLVAKESERGGVTIINNHANVKILIGNHPKWKDALQKNLDSGVIELHGQEYNDERDSSRICTTLNTSLHMPVTGLRSVREAIYGIAEEFAYSPCRDEIVNGPKWDGTERARFIFGDNRNDTDYAVAECFVYGYVKRLLHPGCHWRIMTLLVGSQGVGKTSMADWLAGRVGKIYRASPGDLRNVSKDTKLNIMRANIVLFDDIESLGHADQTCLKSMITVTQDNIRDLYAAKPVTMYRRGIMMGTSNRVDVIPSDPTGQTRYGVVELTEMQDWEWLEENRAQILAEMAHRVGLGDKAAPAFDFKEMKGYVEMGELEERALEWVTMLQDSDPSVKGCVFTLPNGRRFFKASAFWAWVKGGMYSPKDWERKELTARLQVLCVVYHLNNVGRLDGKQLNCVFELPSA